MQIDKGSVVESIEVTVKRAAFDRCSDMRGKNMEKLVARGLAVLISVGIINADDLYYICNGYYKPGAWKIVK